ncbi:hypothetical protein C5Y96_05770 [Blastopirellula marina]|uniref:Uncharacterized protein n=1 Tax=Blastopirellula marina TaxID=124 RepID=A0A2S8G4I3_9BACT|nr:MULTISPECIES: hypothetical protein [Pirellulaceae]PQO39362.1 hypothetical protein C5Y96_05770 [Blastopirellula marina]RCS55670.1 hypothetical protein DTL36_05780 [Bremerella cremea]
MIEFIEGPAAGTHLCLRRTPLLLRVVIDRASGQVDALDQLEDVPRLGESIHVYRREGEPLRGMIDSGKGGYTGPFVAATYLYFPWQPADEVARDNQRWQKWAITADEVSAKAEKPASGPQNTPSG